jgi:hypothetical protein
VVGTSSSNSPDATQTQVVGESEATYVRPVGLRRNVTAARAIFATAQQWELNQFTVSDFGFSPHTTSGIVRVINHFFQRRLLIELPQYSYNDWFTVRQRDWLIFKLL